MKKILKVFLVILIIFLCVDITNINVLTRCYAFERNISLDNKSTSSVNERNNKDEQEKEKEAAKKKVKESYNNISDKTEETLNGAKDVYDDTLDKGEQIIENEISDFWTSFYNIHTFIKSCMPFLFTISIILGMLMFVFVRKNKGIRQWVLFRLCICIPILLVILVYGLPYIKYLGTYAIDKAQNKEYIITEVVDTSSSKETLLIYNDVRQRVSVTNQLDRNGNIYQFVYQFGSSYKFIWLVLNSIKYPILIGSEVLGIFIMLICQKNRKMRKWAKVSLCIVVPSALMIFIYLMPKLEKIFF